MPYSLIVYYIKDDKLQPYQLLYEAFETLDSFCSCNPLFAINYARNIFIIPGTVGNILTILVIGKTKHLFNHCTPLLLNLAMGKISSRQL